MKRVSAESLREKRPDDPLTRAEWNAVVRASQGAGSGRGAAGDGGRMHQPVAQRAVSREVSAVTSGGDIPRWSILQLSAIASGDRHDPIFGASYATDLDGVLATNGDAEVPASGGDQPYRVLVIHHGDVLRIRVTAEVGDQPGQGDRASPATAGVLEEDPDGEFACLSEIWSEPDTGPVAWFGYRPLPSFVGRKMIDFELDDELTTDDATVAGTIVTEYGPGESAPSSSVTLINPMGQAFFGEIGDRGLATWHEGDQYVIIQLVQDCTPEEMS